MKRWHWWAIGSIALCVSIAIYYFGKRYGTAYCLDLKAANLAKDLKDRTPIDCTEFWINRYQTTVQTLLSFGIGAAGLFFVLRQLHALARQNEMTRASLETNTAAQQQSARIAIGRAIGAIDAYSFASFAMCQHVKGRHDGKLFMDSSKRIKLIDQAQSARPAIYAVLTTPALRERWRVFEGEFDNIAVYLAEIEKGGPVNDPTLTRLSKRSPAPRTLAEALLRAGTLPLQLKELRDELDK